MPYKPKNDLYSLLHETGISMGRGPRQKLATRPGQNKVLRILNEQSDGSLRQQDLLKRLGIRAASLSELLKKLEKDGYITRDRTSTGGNEAIVGIPEKGRVSALEREMAAKERDEALFGCLSEDERATLIELLNKLLGTWRKDDGETDGERRERRWRENAAMQEEQREMNALLDAVASE